jgi:hypothetical protein
MQTFTEIVAALVLHSSAAAYSHFGVTLERQPPEKPVAERVVSRTAPTPAPKQKARVASSVPADPGTRVASEAPLGGGMA